MKTLPYPLAVAPAVTGVIVGVVITTVLSGATPDSAVYIALPEYQLWRIIIVAQLSVYFTVVAYIWMSRQDVALPRIPTIELAATGALTVLVVIMPNVLVREGPFPLYGQQYRLLVVVGFGTLAILGVMFRLARVHAAFGQVADVERHAALRKLSRDLLAIAALIVTLATLGSGVIQISLNAMAEAVTDYRSFLTGSHVIAYGGYFSVLLILFFTPVLVAERRAADRLAQAYSDGPEGGIASKLGLQSSMTEHLASAFGVLSPLLGALATRLLT